jgi:secreted trypsin-like serine protease
MVDGFNGRFYLAGITSYGVSECGAEFAPGVYVSVPWIVDWINTNIE